MIKTDFDRLKGRLIPLLVFFICAYATYLRIVQLWHHELIGDELFYLTPMDKPFLEFVKVIPNFNASRYLAGEFFVYYPIFQLFSYNKWALAAPGLISTVAGFYLLYLICKRHFQSPGAYLVTFGIVCFNATLILHATEVRMYTFLPTLVLGTFYLFEKMADVNFEPGIFRKIGALLCFSLVIWFNIFGIIIFGSCFLYTLLSRYKEQDFKAYVKKAVTFACLVLLVAMPYWIWALFPLLVHKYTSTWPAETNVFSFIPNPLHDMGGFLKGIFCNLIGWKPLYVLIVSAILPFIFSYKDRSKQLLFFLLMVLMPLGSVFYLAIATKLPFIQRYFIWLIPCFAFFLGWTWESLFTFRKRKIQRHGTN